MVEGLDFDAATRLVSAFNCGEMSFEGRVWWEATMRECECHLWTGDEPHGVPAAWWADTGMGGTWLVCDAVKRECERQAAADPSMHGGAKFTPFVERDVVSTVSAPRP